MQIMKVGKLLKRFWWIITASKTIEYLPDGVIYSDTSGYILRANKKARECFNIDSADTSVRLKDIISGGMNIINESLRTGYPVSTTGKASGKEDFYIELNALRKGNGYFIVIRDTSKLTRQMTTETRVARFNGEKNAMLSLIADDIKSPITSISGFSQGLLDGLGGELSDKQQKYVKIINSNAIDLYNYMDKLLEFSYVESSLYEPDFQKFDLISSIKELLKDYKPIADSKGLELNFDYSNLEIRAFRLDKKAFCGIIKNIMDTSFAMIDAGCISINLGYPDAEAFMTYGLNENKTYVQISIKNTGEGIEKSETQHICDPYYQIEKDKKTFLRSLRLGIASILAKRSEGCIDINSELMQGVMYNVVLPVEKDKNE